MSAPPLTPKQLRALHIQRRALGLDEETYRATLAQYGVASSKQLSREQARELITRWSIAGAPIGGPYAGHRPAPGEAAIALATPAQRALIARLIPEVPWRSALGYTNWIGSRTSPTKGRPVRTYREAEAVIEALKRMSRRSDEQSAQR
jgi:hypothetical protein